MNEKNSLGSELVADGQTENQDEFRVVPPYPNPTREEMSRTEPTESEAAQGVEDPQQIALSVTAYGLSAATKSERQMRNVRRTA